MLAFWPWKFSLFLKCLLSLMQVQQMWRFSRRSEASGTPRCAFLLVEKYGCTHLQGFHVPDSRESLYLVVRDPQLFQSVCHHLLEKSHGNPENEPQTSQPSERQQSGQATKQRKCLLTSPMKFLMLFRPRERMVRFSGKKRSQLRVRKFLTFGFKKTDTTDSGTYWNRWGWQSSLCSWWTETVSCNKERRHLQIILSNLSITTTVAKTSGRLPSVSHKTRNKSQSFQIEIGHRSPPQI